MKRLFVRNIVTGLFFAAFVLTGPGTTAAAKYKYKKSESNRECKGNGYKVYAKISLTQCKKKCSKDKKCKYIDYATKKRRGTSRCELNRTCKVKKDKRYDIFKKIRRRRGQVGHRKKKVMPEKRWKAFCRRIKNAKKRLQCDKKRRCRYPKTAKAKAVCKKKRARDKIKAKGVRAIAKARTVNARAKVKGKLLTLGKKTRVQAEKLCKSANLQPDVCLNFVAEVLGPKGRKKGKRR